MDINLNATSLCVALCASPTVEIFVVFLIIRECKMQLSCTFESKGNYYEMEILWKIPKILIAFKHKNTIFNFA